VLVHLLLQLLQPISDQLIIPDRADKTNKDC